MKIQTDQLTALRQATEQSKGTRESSDAFAALLAKETGTTGSTQSTGIAAPPLSSLAGIDLASLQAVGETDGLGEINEQERAVMENMDTLLAEWENYADKLAAGSGGDSLKQAYGVLEHIESGVRQLKEDLPESASTGLGSLVNELEVMTVTEKFKFNRGDYI
ncbi:hypothetical protein [Solidesulfovibrio sp.]